MGAGGQSLPTGFVQGGSELASAAEFGCLTFGDAEDLSGVGIADLRPGGLMLRSSVGIDDALLGGSGVGDVVAETTASLVGAGLARLSIGIMPGITPSRFLGQKAFIVYKPVGGAFHWLLLG
ncbi:hypothetical protein COT87_01755 [Candidatus Collierbacteria bacterium CG10_big_fil_rev_8_21_14_0_10_44_9]|uniref:Uncharacterized protein n=1 Tax=Candidatus Collierbacteria bacterium CG10_big_fil_rev_8_21_14_0_10_44_9 TaxID=1974535 RepID=A0A2H0VIS2_9BACT|nr:MAG: hypothetical protein COT87_01755 [Candidatus Collierbacteria bacterium CG10_big_fil_rev_8_21_14_0_10_44_9]